MKFKLSFRQMRKSLNLKASLSSVDWLKENKNA